MCVKCIRNILLSFCCLVGLSGGLVAMQQELPEFLYKCMKESVWRNSKNVEMLPNSQTEESERKMMFYDLEQCRSQAERLNLEANDCSYVVLQIPVLLLNLYGQLMFRSNTQDWCLDGGIIPIRISRAICEKIALPLR